MEKLSTVDELCQQMHESVESLLESLRKSKFKNETLTQEVKQNNVLIEVLYDKIKDLKMENSLLKNSIQHQLTKPNTLNDEHTPEDLEFESINPGWKYINIFVQMIKRWFKLHPGFVSLMNEALAVESDARSTIGSSGSTKSSSKDSTDEGMSVIFLERFNLEGHHPTPKQKTSVASQTPQNILVTKSTQTDPYEPKSPSPQCSERNPGTVPKKSNPQVRNDSPPNSPSVSSQSSHMNSEHTTRSSLKREQCNEVPILENTGTKKMYCPNSKTPHPDANEPCRRRSSDYAKYDYSSCRSNSPSSPSSIPNSYYNSPPQTQIPSLLRINVDTPLNIDPETITWLRRPHRKGCWNCESINHKYNECPKPMSKFCHKCGEVNTFTESCRNCELMKRNLKL